MFPIDWQDVRVSCLNELRDGASSLGVHKVLEIAGALFLLGFCQTLALLCCDTFLTQVYLLGFLWMPLIFFFFYPCIVYGVY